MSRVSWNFDDDRMIVRRRWRPGPAVPAAARSPPVRFGERQLPTGPTEW